MKGAIRKEVDLGEVVVDRIVLAASMDCPPAKHARNGASCCKEFIVSMPPDEMQRIVDIFDLIAAENPRLASNGQYRNVFGQSKNRYTIDRDRGWGCPFLHETRSGDRCSIHTACGKSGLDVLDYKPSICSAWPLNVAKRADGKIHISLYSNAINFCCIRIDRRRGKPLVLGMRRFLIQRIGKQLFRQMLQYAMVGRRTGGGGM